MELLLRYGDEKATAKSLAKLAEQTGLIEVLDESLRLLNQLPGDERDAVVPSLLGPVMESKPSEALALARSVSNPDRRHSSLVRVADRLDSAEAFEEAEKMVGQSGVYSYRRYDRLLRLRRRFDTSEAAAGAPEITTRMSPERRLALATRLCEEAETSGDLETAGNAIRILHHVPASRERDAVAHRLADLLTDPEWVTRELSG
jgi:hypothetical protein